MTRTVGGSMQQSSTHWQSLSSSERTALIDYVLDRIREVMLQPTAEFDFSYKDPIDEKANRTGLRFISLSLIGEVPPKLEAVDGSVSND